MGQKVNPISTRTWLFPARRDSCWTTTYHYASVFAQHINLQRYLESVLSRYNITPGRIFVQVYPSRTRILTVYSVRDRTLGFGLNPTARFKTRYYVRSQKHVSLEVRSTSVCGVATKDQAAAQIDSIRTGTNTIGFLGKAPRTSRFLNKKTSESLGLFLNKKLKPLMSRLSTTQLEARFIDFVGRYTLTNLALFGPKYNVSENSILGEGASRRILTNDPDNSHEQNTWSVNQINPKSSPGKLDGRVENLLLGQEVHPPVSILDTHQRAVSISKQNTRMTRIQQTTSWVVQRLMECQKSRHSRFLRMTGQFRALGGLGVHLHAVGGANGDHENVKSPRLNILHQNAQDRHQGQSTCLENFDGQFTQNLLKTQVVLRTAVHNNQALIQGRTCLHWLHLRSPVSSAQFIASRIVKGLEQRESFRKISRQIIQVVQQSPALLGIRMRCSGRIQGAEMARVELRKYGQTSTHELSNRIDYACQFAQTTYGLFGVQVWLCYRTHTQVFV